MGKPTTYHKCLSVIVSPATLRQFNKRCKSDHVVGQAVTRALVELYLAGHVDLGPNKKLPKKPYHAWLALKCDAILYQRLLQRSREAGIPAGAIVRRLVQTFVDRSIPDRFDRFILNSSPVIAGVGGRGWKVRRNVTVTARL